MSINFRGFKLPDPISLDHGTSQQKKLSGIYACLRLIHQMRKRKGEYGALNISFKDLLLKS